MLPEHFLNGLMAGIAVVTQPPPWTTSDITDVSPASGAQKSETRLCTGSAFLLLPDSGAPSVRDLRQSPCVCFYLHTASS